PPPSPSRCSSSAHASPASAPSHFLPPYPPTQTPPAPSPAHPTSRRCASPGSRPAMDATSPDSASPCGWPHTPPPPPPTPRCLSPPVLPLLPRTSPLAPPPNS